MNQHNIIGNLVRDPEMSDLGDRSVCSFTVAVNRRSGKGAEQKTDYIRVSAWGKTGESCYKYLAKGKKVFVSGTSRAHAWIGQEGDALGRIEMTADRVEFLTPRGAAPGEEDAGRDNYEDDTGDEDDELPF